MGILYIVITILVMVLLVALPIFPFCKVWQRLKSHHQDLWVSKGPFGIFDLMSHPEYVRGFLDIIALADKDETLMKDDPELVKWCRVSREVWKMMPKTFIGQIGLGLIFLYFSWFFSNAIVGIISI